MASSLVFKTVYLSIYTRTSCTTLYVFYMFFGLFRLLHAVLFNEYSPKYSK